ncbi:MAG: hypothetical protein NC212_08650 [Staphylococcus sp.]|nr:hypothetical protein [Staphylococcus sp.]
MKKIGQYTFSLLHGSWAIYRYTNVRSEQSYSMEKVWNEPTFAYNDRESARRRVYELNGWKYKS